MVALGLMYVVLIVALLAANGAYLLTAEAPDTSGLDEAGIRRQGAWETLQSREIQYAIKLSVITCTISALLSLWAAVPIGYLMSRFRFRGKAFVDAILDIPIVLPPLVIGLSLLLLFQFDFIRGIENYMEDRWDFGFTFRIPGVILAQLMVACAFAVRTMRATFDGIDERREKVALTLGASHSQAFWRVAFPEARRGLIVAFTLAWSRALGEFGPILVFAGATRMHTEIMPTSIFLELTVGNIEAAAAVSLVMVGLAMMVLVAVRVFGESGFGLFNTEQDR
jgi:molybdate transport system permease protein